MGLPNDMVQTLSDILSWVEADKQEKQNVLPSRKARKSLSGVEIVRKKKIEVPQSPDSTQPNTLYVPLTYPGWQILRQIRNAFAHNALSYDNDSNQLIISRNKHVEISGMISSSGLKNLFFAFVKPKNAKTK